MNRFTDFCELFADFPTLQKDLSLLDKPATDGKHRSAAQSQLRLFGYLRHEQEVRHHLKADRQDLIL